MQLPDLTDAQRERLEELSTKLNASAVLAPETGEILVELRKLTLLAGIKQETVGARIKADAHLAGNERETTALPGHTREGDYKSSNMSDELTGRTGKPPRPETLLAVAELYCDRFSATSLGDLHRHLLALRETAVKAQTRYDQDREDAAIDGKGRKASGLTYKGLRSARDEARAEADSLRERLDEIEAASSVDREELDRLVREGQVLQDKLARLKTEFLRRDDQLIASELLVESQDRQLAGASAYIDQLEAEVADLNAEVAELRERLGRSWLQRFRQQASEFGRISAERRERGRHRLEPDDDEGIDVEGTSGATDGTDRVPGGSEGGADGAEQEGYEGPTAGRDPGVQGRTGDGGGGVAVHQLVDPPGVRSRVRTLLVSVAVTIVVVAGLVTLAATAAIWPGVQRPNAAFEGCVDSSGLRATPYAAPSRTLFQAIGLVSPAAQSQAYAIDSPAGTTEASVTFAPSAQGATEVLNARSAYYAQHGIPNGRLYTVHSTVVVDPYVDDQTGSLLTACVLRS